MQNYTHLHTRHRHSFSHMHRLDQMADRQFPAASNAATPQLQPSLRQIDPISHILMLTLPQVSARCLIPLQGAKEIKPDLSTGS